MALISIFLLFLFTLNSNASADHSSAAFFIFGDSSVDAGNNNYINPLNRASLKPYGQNALFRRPTGRFSDGRILVDFIAEYAKLPLIPPFLQPSADFTHGANFASGSAVVLPEVAQGTRIAIDLWAQLKNFEEVEKSLRNKLGEGRSKKIIEEAVYFISIGSNDYMESYLSNPELQEKYDPQMFAHMVVGNLTDAILDLYNKGARKFAILSLTPLGCLPAMRASNPNASGGCFEAASSLALAHNAAFNAILPNIGHQLKGFKFTSPNLYNWFNNIINNPSKYGFKDGVNACCGSGPYGSIYNCGDTQNNVPEFQLCDKANQRIWWDSFHPTQRMHQQIAIALWNQLPASGVGSYKLEDLFFHKNN